MSMGKLEIEERIRYPPFESYRFKPNLLPIASSKTLVKKGIKKSSKRITKELLLNFLIKPLFRLDILLSRLYFFSSCYHARQFIQSGYVQVNDKKVKNNVLLKKGDIISFNLSKNQKNFDLSNLFTIHLNNNLFYSFVEVDHYTKTLIILKDLNEVSVDDLSLLITDFFDVYKVN